MSADQATVRRGRRHCALALLVLVAALPLMVTALLRLEYANDDVRPWFPEATPERESFTRFTEAFGADDFLLLSLSRGPGAAGDSEELRKLARALDASGRSGGLVRSATHPEDLIAMVPPGRAADARQALRGFFVGLDGDRECILIRSSTQGLADRTGVHDAILAIAQQTWVPATLERMRVTGPVLLGKAAESETARTLRKVTPITAALSFAVALILLRNLSLTIIALLASSLAAGGALAIIHFFAGTLSDMLSVVPSLAQLLAMSNAVHLINYYTDCEEREHRERSAWRSALAKGVRPTVAASVTTMIGLLSLRVSGIPVVQDFSLYGALGVVCSMIAVLLFVPAGLIVLRPAPRNVRWLRTAVTEPMRRLGSGWSGVVSLVLVSISIVMALGLLRLTPEVRAETFFSERSKFTQDLRWFEQEFGPLQPLDLLFSFSDDESVRQRLSFFGALHTALEGGGTQRPEMRVLSPWSFSSLVPGGTAVALLAPGQVEARLRELGLVGDASTGGGEKETYWRATVRHFPEPDPSQSVVMPEITRAVDEAAQQTGLAPEWQATGVYQLYGTSQSGLLTDLLRSFLLAVALVAPITMLFLRSIRLGAIAMVGNVFPLVVFFGGLGWVGVRIDIATMMIASVAFGIAVDDTIHFLTSLARGFENRQTGGMSGKVRYAFAHSATAIVQTTLIIAIGMLAFALSDFLPSRRFALFTSIVLLLALIGDLVLLPALLQGPFKRWFPGLRQAED